MIIEGSRITDTMRLDATDRLAPYCGHSAPASHRYRYLGNTASRALSTIESRVENKQRPLTANLGGLSGASDLQSGGHRALQFSSLAHVELGLVHKWNWDFFSVNCPSVLAQTWRLAIQYRWPPLSKPVAKERCSESSYSEIRQFLAIGRGRN
ncbi:D-arabinitol 2-dehydrogenase [Fusarium oxysporum f. sp. albedinis]|nr:D-arabinitol 2-dehydrogenase [Fusarium oxysporum f. sp. albedinis]